MMIVIVPVHREQNRLIKCLKNILKLKNLKEIILIANGCDSITRRIVHSITEHKISVLEFPLPLGLDIPRALGAAAALHRGAAHVMFCDGDMVGSLTHPLDSLHQTFLDEGLDMALTDCYPQLPKENTTAGIMLKFRYKLNRLLKIEDNIKGASPSHGPHIISSNLIDTVSPAEIALPPVSLALAVASGLKVGTGVKIPHMQLGSTLRDSRHTCLLVETIIGDHIEAMQTFLKEPRTRIYRGKAYIGYNKNRRFDLLTELLDHNHWQSFFRPGK